MRHSTRRGFSLMELSMVLLISGLVVGFALQANQTTGTDCYGATRTQIKTIQEAVNRFARTNDRLPMPAARNIGVDNPMYGREATDPATITQAGGGTGTDISFGAVPFQALGLPTNYAGDCWGNKFTYEVTTALITSGPYLAATPGAIILKSSISPNVITNDKVAYAIISHGEDQLGAVKINEAGNYGWCVGTDLKTINCAPSTNNAVIVDAPFNDGKDAGASYFDDIVVAASSTPAVFAAATPISNVYCWGDNSSAGLGDGTTIPRYIPTATVLPSGAASFTNIEASHIIDGFYGYANTGGIYRFGKPQKLIDMSAMPTGSLPLGSLSVGAGTNCVQGNDNKTYCWGDNVYGELGIGTLSPPTPKPSIPVDLSAMPPTATKLVAVSSSERNGGSAGERYMCAIADDGNAYCWGDNAIGQLGNGTTNPYPAPVPPNNQKPGVAVDFSTASPAVTLPLTKIASGQQSTCVLDSAGMLYCWGINNSGQLGDGNGGPGVIAQKPVAVVLPAGTPPSFKFTDIVMGSGVTCALGNDNLAYCWGQNDSGQVGNNDPTHANSLVPVAVVTPAGAPPGTTFKKIGAGRFHVCGIASNDVAYCWGSNDEGQLGNGSTTHSDIPTPVDISNVPSTMLPFTSLAVAGWNTCGIH